VEEWTENRGWEGSGWTIEGSIVFFRHNGSKNNKERYK